jgi:hypothetical protein
MKKSEMSALIYPWNVKIMKAEKKKLVTVIYIYAFKLNFSH